VVDASVAFKWTQPGNKEPGAGPAMVLLQEHLEGRTRLHVPSLLFYELANGLVLGRAKPPIDIVEQALGWLFSLSLNVVPPAPEAMIVAARLSRDRGMTLYDATYVALATSLECELLTADGRLARRASGAAVVRLLE